jgi:hypothetical protein
MTLFRISTLAAVVVSALPVLGCASRQQGSDFAGTSWQRICDHPSMSEAAYREAFACRRPELARARHADLGRAGAELAALDRSSPTIR